MLEEKIINNFPNYTISKDGVVKNIKKGVTVKSYILNGFYSVKLVDQKIGYTRLIHTLVADAFLQKNSEGHKHVTHLNGNKLDNRVENLAWRCGSYYKPIYKRGKYNDFTIEKAEQVRNLYFNENKSIKELITMYGVDKSFIYSIVKNGTYKLIYNRNEYKAKYNKYKEKKEPKNKKISAKLIQDAKTENKLTIEQAEVIRELFKSKTKTMKQLATEYNVSKTQIDDIINNIILKPLKKGSVREYWVQRRNRFLEETTK